MIRLYRNCEGQDIASGDTHYDGVFDPRDILSGKASIPSNLASLHWMLFGTVSIGTQLTMENAIAEINLMRKAEKLDALPGGFVCNLIGYSGLHPSYRLVA
jgi:hypothetical protein